MLEKGGTVCGVSSEVRFSYDKKIINNGWRKILAERSEDWRISAEEERHRRLMAGAI